MASLESPYRWYDWAARCEEGQPRRASSTVADDGRPQGNDSGQFFTPREVIRAIDPKLGETVYVPGCGTGDFLVQACEHMRHQLGD